MAWPHWPALLIFILVGPVLAGCMGNLDETVDPDGPLAPPAQPLAPGETDPRLDALLATDAPRLGNPDAAVAVVAFDAPGCSNCRFFHNNRFPDLQADFIDPGQVVWYGRPWTIGYAYDERGNLALACAHREGGDDAYWHYLSYIYGAGSRSRDELRAELAHSAATHDYDAAAVHACFDGDETKGSVDAAIQVARDHGASGSPVFFVLGPDETRIVGMNQVRAAIEDAVAASG